MTKKQKILGTKILNRKVLKGRLNFLVNELKSFY